MRPRIDDDAGGIWVKTGIVLGVLFYALTVVMLLAGVTSVLPLVIVPPALVLMIALNSIIGGPRRPQPRPVPLGGAMADGSEGQEAETDGGAGADSSRGAEADTSDDAGADVTP